MLWGEDDAAGVWRSIDAMKIHLMISSFELKPDAAGDSRFAQHGRDRRDDAPSADPHRRVNPKFRGDAADGGKRRRRRGGK